MRIVPDDTQQTYCDWCYADLTNDDRARTRQLLLEDRHAWACGRCIDSDRVRQPPDSWLDEREERPLAST